MQCDVESMIEIILDWLCFVFFSHALNLYLHPCEQKTWTRDPEADDIERVTKEVEEVKTIMFDNVDKLIDRQQHLGDLNEASMLLVEQGKTLKKKASTVRFRKQCCSCACCTCRCSIWTLVVLACCALVLAGLYFFNVVRI